MENSKLIFIDVDGTLVMQDQSILASTKKAIQQAKENGHKLFLCTGRSKPELFPSIRELGFDGYICAGGSYLEIENEIIYHDTIQTEVLRDTVDFLLTQGIDFYIESDHGIYASQQTIDRIKHINGEEMDDNHPFIQMFQIVESFEILQSSKICFLGSDTDFGIIHDTLDEYYEVMQATVPSLGENSGELVIKGYSKKTAVQEVVQFMKWNPENTFAIGDGLNDIDMLEACQIGVAMGNAQEGLKEIADYVTTSIEDDGFYHAFARYNLL